MWPDRGYLFGSMSMDSKGIDAGTLNAQSDQGSRRVGEGRKGRVPKGV